MMNYYHRSTDTNTFDVVESKTETVVATGLNEKEVKQRVRFLNFGGGFDGWSPAFIHERIEIT